MLEYLLNEFMDNYQAFAKKRETYDGLQTLIITKKLCSLEIKSLGKEVAITRTTHPEQCSSKTC